jgi:hypothetical protein
MVTGLFNDRESAEFAYAAAAERGYGKERGTHVVR